MCNFIIRPVEAYATVDINSDDTTTELVAGQKVKVKHVAYDGVVVETENIGKETYEVKIPLEVYIHTFSLQNPKQEKKESK